MKKIEFGFIIVEGIPKRCLTEKHKRKISESKKGKCVGKENHFYGRHHSKKTKREISEAQKGEKGNFYGRKHSEKTKRLQSEIKKGERNPFYGKKHTEKTKRKISDAVSGEKHPLYNKRGKDNPKWKGGLTVKYPFNFNNDLKERIKIRDDYGCQNPDCEGGNYLCVHHINYDKEDLRETNLITLCDICNPKANKNRDYWEEKYTKMVGGVFPLLLEYTLSENELVPHKHYNI